MLSKSAQQQRGALTSARRRRVRGGVRKAKYSQYYTPMPPENPTVKGPFHAQYSIYTAL
jgi:hypothetical protein